MIAFQIKGHIKGKSIVEQYIVSILRELNIHRLRKSFILVEFTSRLADEALGVCVGDENFAVVTVARNSGWRPLSYQERMQILAHELVHAKQFLRGELGYNCAGDWRWKNRNAGGYKYENQPWEKEATRLEKPLFDKCFPTNQLRGDRANQSTKGRDIVPRGT